MPTHIPQFEGSEPDTRNPRPSARRKHRWPGTALVHPSTRKARWFSTSLQMVLLGLLIFLSVGAADTGTRFNTLGHKLMCTCGCGQVLLECNHVGCPDSDRMRHELMAAINRGGSDTDVLNWFVQKYGPVVLAAPTTIGFYRVAWFMPYAALAFGQALTMVIVRAWNARRRPVGAPASAPPSAEMEEWRRRVHEDTEI